MAIRIIPGKGLEFDMDHYVRLRTYVGGPDYWYQDNQRVLRSKLHPFLPEMSFNPENNTVLASLVEDGVEWLSQSCDISEAKSIPTSERKRLEDILTALKEALPRVWGLLAESVNILFSFFTVFMVLLYVVFILWDYESIATGWVHLVPPRYRPFVVGVFNDIKDGMNRYFRGQALVAFCVGILHAVGFLIIDFPLAVGLGLLIGLLNMVPYLQIIGYIPTVILAILKAADTGQNFWLILLGAVIVFVVVQLIQDMVLVPRIMGKITGLNPAIILLSLSIWGSLMGMLGMIIALPLTTLMLSYYQRFIINKEDIHQSHSSDSQSFLE